MKNRNGTFWGSLFVVLGRSVPSKTLLVELDNGLSALHVSLSSRDLKLRDTVLFPW